MTTPSAPTPITGLDRAAVGAPITRAGVSAFPIYVVGTLPQPVITGVPDAVKISEAEVASVPTLSVTSVIDDPFLLVEGETIAGGRQQRTLNVTVLVPPRERLDIPVSCVEAGRWGGGSEFTGSSGQVSRRVRRAKSVTVAENVRRSGGKRSDQSLIWDTVGYELNRLGVESDTANFAAAEAVFDRPDRDRDRDRGRGRGRGRHERLAEAAAELTDLGPLPGQCGVVVAHGSRIVAAEIFATPDLLAGQWAAMVRAQVLDAPERVEGRPSASRALRFLQRLAAGDAVEAAGVGLGVERHIRTRRLVGQALVWDGSLVHASGFALAA